MDAGRLAALHARPELRKKKQKGKYGKHFLEVGCGGGLGVLGVWVVVIGFVVGEKVGCVAFVRPVGRRAAPHRGAAS